MTRPQSTPRLLQASDSLRLVPALPSPDAEPKLDGRLLITVSEAARLLTVSRSLMYELITAGEIRSIHVGRLRRVPMAALIEFVEERDGGHSAM